MAAVAPDDAPDSASPEAPAPLPAKVPALNPDTQKVVMVDSGDIPMIQQAGWALLNRQQALEHEFKEANESPLGQAATIGAGFDRGLTGGLSDLALDKSGAISGPELKQLSEANPVESGVAHAAGIGAGLVAGGEGSAAGEGLGAAGEIGGSLAGGVPGLAAQLAERATGALGLKNAAGIGAKFARGAVTGAIETPFYGAGDEITEDVFDNKPLVAESLLANAAKDAVLGGLTGGALEGSLGLAKRFAPDALGSASKALDKLAEKFKPEDVNSSDDIRAFSKALGDTSDRVDDQIAEFHRNAKSEMVEKLIGNAPATAGTQAFADNLLAQVRDGLERARVSGVVGDAVEGKIAEVENALAGAKSKADVHIALDSLKKKTDPLLKFKAPLTPEQDAAIKPLRNAIGSVRDALEDSSVFGAAGDYQKQVNAALRPYYAAREAVTKGETSLFSKIKTKLDAQGNVISAGANEVVASPGKAASLVGQEARNSPLGDLKKQALDNYISASKGVLDTLEQGTYSKLGRSISSNQFAKNLDEIGTAKAKAVASKLQEFSKPGGIKGDLVGGWTHMLGIPGALPNAAAKVAGGVASVLTGQKNEILYKVAREAARTSEKIRIGMQAAINAPAAKTASRGVDAAIDILSAHGQRVRGEGPLEAVQRRVAEVDKLQQDPERRAKALADATATMQPHAPGISGHVQMAMQRRDSFLASVAPRNPIPPGANMGQTKPYKPTPAEAQKFAVIHRAVMDPTSIIGDMQDGRLTPAAVSAVAATSPELYSQMQKAALDHLATKSDPPSSEKSAQLSILLGRPASFAIANLPSTQSDYAQGLGGSTGVNPSANPESSRARVSGLAKVNLAKRSATKFDSIESE